MYYILDQQLGLQEKVIKREVVGAYNKQDEAKQWLEYYVKDKYDAPNMNSWSGNKITQESETSYAYYSRTFHQFISRIELKKTTITSLDEIRSKFEMPLDRKAFQELQASIDNKNKQNPQREVKATSFTNNQNKTSMANITFKRNSATSRDKNNRVLGNQYRYTGNGKSYQLVPESMISLPEGNAFIVMRKTQYLNSVNPKTGEKNRAVYVYGYSNVKDNRGGFKHTQTMNRQGQPRVRRYYFVARLIFRGGRPNLALYRYMGYNQILAKQVFAEIACDEAQYIDAQGNWHNYRKGKITSKDIVAASVRRAQNLEKMKTAAYGDKAARRAWAQANVRR